MIWLLVSCAVFTAGVLGVGVLFAPWTCPHCFRLNPPFRKRTGRVHKVEYSPGVMETWTEIRCRRCRRNYWFMRIDGMGTSAHIDFRPRDGALQPAFDPGRLLSPGRGEAQAGGGQRLGGKALPPWPQGELTLGKSKGEG